MRRNIASGFEEIKSGAIWPLAPIMLALGIMMADRYPFPAISSANYLILLPVFIFLAYRYGGKARQALTWLGLIAFGFCRLGFVYGQNDTQPFDYRYYGPIEGRVVMIDQSGSSALRLTLDQVELDGRFIRGDVRISLHGGYHRERIRPGVIIQTTGYLGPPSGPAEPGGYDFRKRAWADGLAAVGYSRKPLIAGEVKEMSMALRLLDFRLEESKKYKAALGDKIGGFAAAIFIGDRSEIDREVVEAMRRSNLAHLLAISGMHMGTVCGLLFLFFRRFFSLSSRLSGRPWAQGLAVFAALSLTTIYWVFSGMAYSATRAWLMAVLLFAALIFHRRVLSLRSVALVALGLLAIDPMALGDVGFQMSFAATTALIAFFSRVNLGAFRMRRLYKGLLALALTSLVAGFATAPFSAFHFNTVPKYGLIANLLAVSVMSFVVLPAGIVMMLLRPFGLEDYPLWLAGRGIEWIIGVGKWVSELPDPVWTVRAAFPLSLSLIVAGGLVIVLGRWRAGLLGTGLVALALFLWPYGERPLLLVSDDARFFGLREQEKSRSFSRATGHSFVAEIWAKRDGDVFDQEGSATKFEGDPKILPLEDGWQLVFTTTKKGAAKTEALCKEKNVIIAAQGQKTSGNCLFYNEKIISDFGGMAVDIKGGEAIITPNIDLGRVPWRDRSKN